MEEFDKESGYADERTGDRERGAGHVFVAIIVATAVLYLAQGILLPLAMASILAVASSPIASRLERVVGRFISAAFIVVAAVAAILVIGYLLTIQLTSIAVDVSGYSENIASKIEKLEGSTPLWLQSVEHGVDQVQHQLGKQGGHPKGVAPKTAQIPTSSGIMQEIVSPTLPILLGIGKSLLVIVLFFFLLYERKSLRDRLVRLAARARIMVAVEAIEAAGSTVGRYLFFVSLINLGFGIAIGIVVWLVGLPNAAFWGGLAFILRYIPYVGSMAAAVLPTLVAIAVFPGWSKSFEVFGSFVALDQVAAQFFEPFLIGRGISISPVALLFSAMYWSWLWGLPGLLLATPLTACLKVAGDYIPELGFLGILLGADTVLENYHDYYRMLLELDRPGAVGLVVNYCDQHGLEETFDDVLVPALMLTGEERLAGHISRENEEFVIETTRGLVKDLGGRFSKPPTRWRLRVLGFCAPGEVHNLGMMMLLELLRHAGAAANLVSKETPHEICEFVKGYSPDIVCLSCTMTERLPAAVELVRMLKLESPGLTILAGGAAALSAADKLLDAGCTQVSANRGETRRLVRRFALRRARSQLVRSKESFTARTGVLSREDGRVPIKKFTKRT
jgi:predicted PurR-regulated permease PerM